MAIICWVVFLSVCSLCSFSSVLLLVLEQRREFVTLKRKVFFFIDMDSNFYFVLAFMVRRNYSQWNRFKTKEIWGGHYLIKVHGDVGMLLIWIKIRTVQKFVGQIFSWYFWYVLNCSSRLCLILQSTSIPASTREQPVVFLLGMKWDFLHVLKQSFETLPSRLWKELNS